MMNITETGLKDESQTKDIKLWDGTIKEIINPKTLLERNIHRTIWDFCLYCTHKKEQYL